jgi:hypothetical protein
MSMAGVVTGRFTILRSHCGRSGSTNLRQVWPEIKLWHANESRWCCLAPRVPSGSILHLCAERRPSGQIWWLQPTDTLQGVKPTKGEDWKCPEEEWPAGAIDTQHGCKRQPRQVTTTRIRWPPAEVHCATHEHQPVCNPMPKTQTLNPKTATQGQPEWWRSPGWVDMATVTHVNRVSSNIHRPEPKLQSRRQSDCGL